MAPFAPELLALFAPEYTIYTFRYAILCQPGGWLLARTKAETLLNGGAIFFVDYDRQRTKTNRAASLPCLVRSQTQLAAFLQKIVAL